MSLLREEITRSDLLPGSYAKYRPVIADALHFFLQRLSDIRLREIFTQQMHLALSASTATRVVALLGHVPVLHKLGQVIARDRRLSEGLRHGLQELESLTPRTSQATIVQLLDRECKGWRKAGIELERQPLAEGSVAVIMPFAWRERSGLARQGVFKLLKPGIESRLEEDLEILSMLATFLDERCDYYALPALDYRDTFETIRQLLLHEVRFEEEQKNLVEAADAHFRTECVVIPTLLPFCSNRLTAMERLYGNRIPIGGCLPEGVSPGRLASVIAQSLVAHPIFTTQAAPIFHADPHAGNLLLMSGDRLGILDWSLIGRLPRRERVALVQLVLGALALDIGRMERAIEELTEKKPRLAALAEVLQSSLRELSWGAFPGISWLTGLLDKLVLRAGMRFHANLLLFRKTLLTLEGVLADLGGADETAPQAVFDAVVGSHFLGHFIAEWPARFLAPFNAKSPATHLSNSDLVSLAWSGPAAFMRRWSEVGLGFLAAAE